MHDLLPLGAVITYSEEHEALLDFAANEKAPATRHAYRQDLRAFEVWCRERGLCPLPAEPRTVAWHISAIAQAGLSVSSIGRIGRRFRASTVPLPPPR